MGKCGHNWWSVYENRAINILWWYINYYIYNFLFFLSRLIFSVDGTLFLKKISMVFNTVSHF